MFSHCASRKHSSLIKCGSCEYSNVYKAIVKEYIRYAKMAIVDVFTLCPTQGLLASNEQRCLYKGMRERRKGDRDTMLLLPRIQVFYNKKFLCICFVCWQIGWIGWMQMLTMLGSSSSDTKLTDRNSESKTSFASSSKSNSICARNSV